MTILILHADNYHVNSYLLLFGNVLPRLAIKTLIVLFRLFLFRASLVLGGCVVRMRT